MKDMVFVKTHDISELSEELIGKQVVLGGWIEDLRKLGKMSFITLRDISGISQVIVKGELNDNLGEINRQSAVRIKGIVQETKARDFAFEIKAEEIDKILQPVHKSLFIESNPSPVKYAAKLIGLCDDNVRLPLVTVLDPTKVAVKKALISAKLINE